MLFESISILVSKVWTLNAINSFIFFYLDRLLLLLVIVATIHLSSAQTFKKYGSLRKCNGVCSTLNRDCVQKARKTNFYKLLCEAINR